MGCREILSLWISENILILLSDLISILAEHRNLTPKLFPQEYWGISPVFSSIYWCLYKYFVLSLFLIFRERVKKNVAFFTLFLILILPLETLRIFMFKVGALRCSHCVHIYELFSVSFHELHSYKDLSFVTLGSFLLSSIIFLSLFSILCFY